MGPEAWLITAAGIIGNAIDRHDTRHAIFHGCYDWHSAVHGHWALLRIARVTGEPRFAEHADRGLTAADIETEAAVLRAEPRFEMPYGRAWFLRLAIEHALVTGTDRLRAMADQVAASIVESWQTTPPRPDSREYASDAWALAQVAAYGRSIDDAALLAAVDHHVARSFLDPGAVPGFAVDHQHTDFFSPRAAWLYLIATTQPVATLARMLDAAALDDRTLAPVAIKSAAHHHGVNWSRAWMLRRLSLICPDEPLYRRAYDAHVEIGLRDHARGAGNYHAYDHWVPQFAVYGLTEGT